MRACAITKDQILQMLKIITIYAVGLLIGAASGFLPLFALLAGFPILVARQKVGLAGARIMALATLLITLLLVDPVSFVFVGLGVAVGYSLLAWRGQERSLGSAYRLSFLGGGIWLAVSNWSVVLLEQRNLLAVINEVVAKSFALLQESMAALEIYTPEQMELISKFSEQAAPLFNENWLTIAFIFICLSTTACLLLLGRYEQAIAVRLANWRDLSAPGWLAIITVLAYALKRLAPGTLSWLANNTLGIGSFVLFLAGYALIYFYMRHLHFSRAIGILFTAYLLLSPWLRPILTLIGTFDALFDYRHFAKAKIEPQ